MLDRSIPFCNVILRCDSYRFTKEELPDGFSIVTYTEGYEKEWARLEVFVGDFETEEGAEQYFIETYMCNKEELLNNAFFLLNENKEVIGSCIAWKDVKDNSSVASLHWLMVDEKYQGMGLGKALCRKVMNTFHKQMRLPVYIHTQPWSWKAIFLYISLGFKIQKKDTFSKYINQYDKMMEIMKNVVDEDLYYRLMEFSEE